MKNATASSLIEKWRQAFSIDKAKEKPETSEPSLRLIRKEPVTFQLSRLENPVDFDRMNFVVKACQKNADRLFKTVLHVERTRTGSRLVATDGNRLHVAEISKKIKSGDYKPHVTKDVIALGLPIEDVKFPAWAKVVPEPEKTQKRGSINLAESGMGRDKKETEKLSLAFNSFVKQTGEPVNIRYLEDLTKQEWTVFSQGEKQKAIILREKIGKTGEPDTKKPLAVIMPIRQAA